MLSVASPRSDLPFKKSVDMDAATLLDHAATLAFADEDNDLGGATSTEHSRDVTTDFESTEEIETDEVKVTTVTTTRVSLLQLFTGDSAATEDDNDSEYHPEDEEEEDTEAEEEDDAAYLASLESQLDEHADEVDDYYLQHMLAKRPTLEGDEAAWVDSYIARQRQWKETHGTSIDEMDLDLLRPARRLGPKKTETQDVLSDAATDAWHGRGSPPPTLRAQPYDVWVSLIGVGVFVGIALAVQFYVAFQRPLYS